MNEASRITGMRHCPICQSLIERQESWRRVMDGNSVYVCLRNPKEHVFWINPRGHNRIHLNPDASETNCDSVRSWQMFQGSTRYEEIPYPSKGKHNKESALERAIRLLKAIFNPWQLIELPVRRVFPQLYKNEIVGVQPMEKPCGEIYLKQRFVKECVLGMEEDVKQAIEKELDK